MNSRDNLLFNEGDLDGTLRDQLATAREKVDRIPQDQFLNSPEDEVVQHVVSELEVEPLVLFEDRAEMDQRETKIDVSGWRDRNPFGDRGRFSWLGWRLLYRSRIAAISSYGVCGPVDGRVYFPVQRCRRQTEQASAH
jgi:hypothetical protein